jgi:DNA-binding transcriptional LysR family regulator
VRNLPRSRDRWLDLELQHLAALAAVARERSFTRAAECLGYAQPVVSRQIALLEELAGTRLVERRSGSKPIRLTEAGEVLLGHANDVLATIEMAKTDFGHADASNAGEVRVGFFSGAPTQLLLATLEAFGERYPHVEVLTRECVTDTPLFGLLRDGSVDVVFANLPPESGPFEVRELVRVPWMLVVAADADIARRRTPPSPAEIAELPIIGANSSRFDPWNGSPLARAVGTPNIVFRSDSAQTVQALVAAGIGAAIMPRLTIRESDPRIAVIDLGDLVPALSVGVVWLSHRRLTGAVDQFRDVLQGMAGAFSGESSASKGKLVLAP